MEIFFFWGGLGNFAGHMTLEVKADKRVYHSCPQVCVVMFAVVSFNKSPTKNSSTMGVWDSKHWERFDSHIILKKNEIQSNHYGQNQLNSEIKYLLTGCKISSNSFGLFFLYYILMTFLLQFLGLFEKVTTWFSGAGDRAWRALQYLHPGSLCLGGNPIFEGIKHNGNFDRLPPKK